ncbi:MAG: hypothetical protein ACRDFS_08210 [Chloroflexota bacterium]
MRTLTYGLTGAVVVLILAGLLYLAVQLGNWPDAIAMVGVIAGPGLAAVLLVVACSVVTPAVETSASE